MLNTGDEIWDTWRRSLTYIEIDNRKTKNVLSLNRLTFAEKCYHSFWFCLQQRYQEKSKSKKRPIGFYPHYFQIGLLLSISYFKRPLESIKFSEIQLKVNLIFCFLFLTSTLFFNLKLFLCVMLMKSTNFVLQFFCELISWASISLNYCIFLLRSVRRWNASLITLEIPFYGMNNILTS